jgi:hypothetical protein
LLLITTGGDGLSSIKTEVLANRTEINNNETKIDGIKSVTDALPNNIATQTDTSAIETKVDNVPTNAELTSALGTQTSQIKGLSNRDLTEVYDNQRGTDNALLANDPRLDNLDAAISSRSTLTDTEVWNSVSRTLTAATPLTPADAQQVWDILLTSVNVPGSVGRLVKDFLDVAVSTRSTLTELQLDTKLAPLATEANVDDVKATVENENNENQLLLNTALALLNQIRPQTDKIVSDGAQETTVTNEAGITQGLINGVANLVNLVKVKTDNIPANPALESSVQNIPTNPLLDDDPRLNDLSLLSNLDVAVSTRAESFPGDYATKGDLDNAESNIISEVNANEAKIDQIPLQPYFDTKFAEIDVNVDLDDEFNMVNAKLEDIQGAGFDTSVHSLVKVRENQDNIGGGPGGGASAAQIWNYPNRSLTQDVVENIDLELAKNEIINTSTDYNARMNTTVDIENDKQILIAWLDRDGQTLEATENCRVEIRQDDGTLVWNKADSTPDARGVFRLEQEGVEALYQGRGNNFYVTITISFDGQDYRTIQPFYTIG